MGILKLSFTKIILKINIKYLLKQTFWLNFLFHFRFWGTCAEHARQLHRYTHGSVICCLPPLHPHLAFLPMLSLPNSPPPLYLPYSPNRPQCVVLLSLCPHVLIVHHSPMSENMWYLIFCSCVSLLIMMVSRFIHVPTKDTNSLFFDGCIIFHGVYVPHFPCPVYHQWAFGLVPGLCYCKQCCNEHLCACVLIVE